MRAGPHLLPTKPPGTVYWITGLSGSGKTTIADALSSILGELGSTPVRLDGDALRQVFSDIDRHDRQSRLSLAHRYSGLCRLLSDQGLDVICSTISLFKEIHDWNRANMPRYVEVFLDVDGDTLRRRDTKGIYRRAQTGEIRDVAGLDLAVDVPEAPDLIIRNDGREEPRRVAQTILDAARRVAVATSNGR